MEKIDISPFYTTYITPEPIFRAWKHILKSHSRWLEFENRLIFGKNAFLADTVESCQVYLPVCGKNYEY
jgi:hypothetical protein